MSTFDTLKCHLQRIVSDLIVLQKWQRNLHEDNEDQLSKLTDLETLIAATNAALTALQSSNETHSDEVKTAIENLQAVLADSAYVLRDDIPDALDKYLLTRSLDMGIQPDGDLVNDKADGQAFETTALLGADAVYTSPWTDTDGWKSLEVAVTSDVASAPRGICIEYTDDVQAGSPAVRLRKEFDFGAIEIQEGGLDFDAPVRLDGFRIVYTNGSDAQTNFYLAANLRTAQVEISRTSDGGILTSNPWQVLFKDTFEISGALPSGATPSFDAVGPVVAANVIDTGWLNVRQYKDQLINAVFDVTGVRIFLMNASDSIGSNSPTSSFASGTENLATPGFGFPAVQGAAFFGDYYRIVIINDSGTDSNAFSIRSMAGDTPVGEVFQSLDQQIFSFYPAPIVQAVIKGEAGSTGSYEAVKTDGNGRLTFTSGSNFARLLARQVEDNSRLRVDSEPGTGYIYLGSAPRGTAGSATEWEVVKINLSATLNPDDIQYIQDIAWDDRTNAVHWDATA